MNIQTQKKILIVSGIAITGLGLFRSVYMPLYHPVQAAVVAMETAAPTVAHLDQKSRATGETEAVQAGRYYIGDTEYFADAQGVLYSSTWVLENGETWYYVNEDGTIFKNGTTPDGYDVDENGCFYEEEVVDEEYTASYAGFAYSTRELRLNLGTADIIWKTLKGAGWTDTAVAGVLGNFQQESGIVPSRIQSNGVGFGIGQWSFERRTAMESYAAARSKNPASLYLQLEYMLVEPGERAYVKNYSKTNFANAAEAAIDWARRWERYNEDGSLLRVRIPYAEAYYAHYVHGTSFLASAYQYTEADLALLASSSNAESTASAEIPLTQLEGSSQTSAANQTSSAEIALTGWVFDGIGYWYAFPGGTYPANEWRQINGIWYRFDASGYILRNTWYTDEKGRVYYFDGNGALSPDTPLPAESEPVHRIVPDPTTQAVQETQPVMWDVTAAETQTETMPAETAESQTQP